MATRTPVRSPTRTPPRGPAPLFGIFVLLWLAFAAALLFDQGALDSVWQWLTGLPLLLEIVLWILFLPIALGLWIWESDLSLWLRLLLITVIAVVNISVMGPKPGMRQNDESRIDDDDHHEIPPGVSA